MTNVLNWTVLSVLTGHMNHMSSLLSLDGEVNPELALLCRAFTNDLDMHVHRGSYSLGISFKSVFV